MGENNKKPNIINACIGYTLGNYFIKGLSFFTVPIFVRLLKVEEYGLYNIFLSYESIICIIIAFSMHSCIKNANYKYKEDFYGFLSSILLLSCFSLIVWIVVVNILFCINANILEFNQYEANLLIISSFGSAIIMIYNSAVSLKFQYKKFLKIALINSICNIFLSIALIIWILPNNGYIARITGMALPCFLIGLYIVYLFFRKSIPQINVQYWKYALLYSLPIIPHGISQVILSQFDRIMIQKINGDKMAGIYSFAYNIYTIIFITASALDNVWGPWFYKEMNARNTKLIEDKAKEYVFGMSLFVSIVLLIAPELVTILGSNVYRKSIYCVVPLAIGGYFAFLYNMPASVEYYYEKTKYIAVGTAGAAAINIILNYIFIVKYGYIAAAYTTAVTYGIYFLFHMFLAIKLTGKSIFSIVWFVIGSLIVILSGILSLVFNHIVFIRIIMAFFVFVVFLIWSYKQFSIKKHFKRN